MAEARKYILSFMVAVLLTVAFVTLTNVGMSIFFDAPDYNAYCPPPRPVYTTNATCIANDGMWQEDGYPRFPQTNEKVGYCDVDYTCRMGYDVATKDFNQIRFYIFAGVGLLLTLLGLFIPYAFLFGVFTWTGLLSGIILIAEAVIFNFSDKVSVFITLIVVILLIVLAVWRVFRKL